MGILKSTRRKFIITSALAAGGFAVAKKIWPFKKPKKATAKFLTHDGKLVEIDLKDLPANVKKVSDDQVDKWVWSKRFFKEESS